MMNRFSDMKDDTLSLEAWRFVFSVSAFPLDVFLLPLLVLLIVRFFFMNNSPLTLAKWCERSLS